MFGHRDVFHSLGPLRLGGPVLLKDLLPALLEDLHEAYVARGGPALPDGVFAGPPEVEGAASFSRAA